MDGQCRAAFERVEAELNNLQAYGCRGAWSGVDDGCSYVWSRFFGPLILFYQATVNERANVLEMVFYPGFSFREEQMNEAVRALNWINASLKMGCWMLEPMEMKPFFVLSAPWGGGLPDEEFVKTMYTVMMSVTFEYAPDLFALRKGEKSVDDILMRVEGVFLKNCTLE